MNKTIISILLSLSSLGCFAQQAKKISLEQLNARIRRGKDTTYVINFWATWCKPCIKELPLFEKIQQLRFNGPVKVLLISTDAANNSLKAVSTFISKQHIVNEVCLITDPPANYLPLIDKKWTGSLPATLIITSTGYRKFYENALSFEQLVKNIQAAIN